MSRALDHAPNAIRSLIGKAYAALPIGVRYGRTYRETASLLRESRYWSRERIESFQVSRLRELLQHALANVPYYSETLKSAGVVPEDIRALSDLRGIALLDKETILARAVDLRDRNLPERDFIPVTTGGSSGTPLRFFQQKSVSWEREVAFIGSLWERVGFRYGKDARLVLRGSPVANADGILYRPATREFVCSTYHTEPERLARYLDLLLKERIPFIHGHVSSIALFAQYVISTGAKVALKAALGGSEKVFPFQRDLVQRAFGCRLFSWYGQSEQVALAGECEHSPKYHVFPEYGILELIDEAGDPITRPGELGEIVGTGFNNPGMPFIRYRTGDLAVFAEGPCPDCGRNYPLLERIEGRNYEYVITRSGNPVSLTGLIYGQHFKAFGCIAKMQIDQAEMGKITIRIVPGAGYDAKEVETELKGKIHDAVGGEIEAEVQVVGRIPPSAMGKHRFLIQKLKPVFGPKAGSPEPGR
jgi:phenylacetate-CoA ligase